MADAQSEPRQCEEDEDAAPAEEQRPKDERTGDERHVPNRACRIPFEPAAPGVGVLEITERIDLERPFRGFACKAHLASPFAWRRVFFRSALSLRASGQKGVRKP